VTASVPPWPALDSNYQDEFGPIDLKVYQAAGEIWREAAIFGEFTLHDQDEAFSLMLKAVANVTSVIASGARIERLKPYLMKTYKRLVAKEHERRLKREQPISDSDSEVEEQLVAEIVEDLDHKILLREAFRHMKAEERDLSYLVMMGNTFEEIAELEGLEPAAVRQRWKRLRAKIRYKVAREDNAEIK
jgi:RNA polymerase sigma factor (sigma-70 family)